MSAVVQQPRERPILFSAPMVKCLLDGTKLQTRRIACHAGEADSVRWADNEPMIPAGKDGAGYTGWIRELAACPLLMPLRCPYGNPGDRLWVRETIRRDGSRVDPETGYEWEASAYVADGARTKADAWPWSRKTLPSIHCPRGLSRITLEITSVRVERLRDISGDDAIAEGITIERCGCEVCRHSAQMCPADCSTAIMEYASLWESINGKRPGCAWTDNPWVWVLEFRR